MKKTLIRVSAFSLAAVISFHSGVLIRDVETAPGSLAAPSEQFAGSGLASNLAEVINVPVAYGQSESQKPSELVIPSISLHSPVQPLGLNAKGEMDVPSGQTNNVGWYQYGTTPGEAGTAVMDAHVFAAFSKLKDVKEGNDIYVVMDSGRLLHFSVEEVAVYDLSIVPRQKLFVGDGAPRLNLITCAGELTKDGSTYNKRLIVFAKLVK